MLSSLAESIIVNIVSAATFSVPQFNTVIVDHELHQEVLNVTMLLRSFCNLAFCDLEPLSRTPGQDPN